MHKLALGSTKLNLKPQTLQAERMYKLALDSTPDHLDCLWSYAAFLQVRN
jgi:hypothetical protein